MLVEKAANQSVGNQTALFRLFTREEVLPGLSVLFLCAVWVPATVLALLLLMRINSLWVPASILSLLILGLLTRFLFRNLSRAESLLLTAVVLTVTLTAACISIFFYDITLDGRWYHTDIILALLQGINPIYQNIPGVAPVWPNHYPKAMEYFSALVIHNFHYFQLGKIYNFLLMFASASYAGVFFRRLGIKGRRLLLLVAVTAISPVVASQMVSYFVDGAMASLLSLMLMTIVSTVFFQGRFDRALFVFAASLAMAVKFTGVVYVAATVFLLLLTRLLLRRRYSVAELRSRLTIDITSAVLAGCLGLLVLGFNPYVTNIIQGKNLFYPILGLNKIDVMVGNTPLVLLPYNKPERFLISFFAKSNDYIRPGDANPPRTSESVVGHLKIPFTVHKEELVCLAAVDIRLAGGGIFFSGIMLGSMAVFLLARGWRRNASLVLAMVLIVGTTFVNPECWWARYAPQLALLPVILLVAGLRADSKGLRAVALGLGVLLILNNLLLLGGAVGATLIKTIKLNSSFARIAQVDGPGEYWAYRDPQGPIHYEQFSGLKGIVICGELDPHIAQLPSGGFPVNANMQNRTEVTLYKGRCSTTPQF